MAKVGELVMFEHAEDGRGFHSHITGQVPPVMLITDRLFDMRAFEVRPLSFHSFFSAWTRNHYRLWHWRLARLCFAIGLIDIPQAKPFAWRKYWRWRFWRKRRFPIVQ
mgnify:CR=1 FL=1